MTLDCENQNTPRARISGPFLRRGGAVRHYLLAIWLLIVAVPSPSLLFGQPQPKQDPSSEVSKSSEFSIQVGFDGHVRLGRWSPLFVEELSDRKADSFEATTLDGDGLKVTYAGRLQRGSGQAKRSLGWIRIGRKVKQIQVRLLSGDEDSLGMTFTVPVDANKVAKSTQSISLSLGAQPRAAEAFAQTATGQKNNKDTIVVSLENSNQVPINQLALDSVSTLLLIATEEVVESVSDLQLEAIDQWIKNGGKLIFSVPGSFGSELLSDNGKFRRFSSGSFQQTKMLPDSGIFESFVNSRNRIEGPIDSLQVAQVKVGTSRPILVDAGLQLATRRAYGLGEIVFIPFDMNAKVLTDWTNYPELIRKFSGASQLVTDDVGPTTKRSGSVSHYGYTDLTGQLRVGLDNFSNVGFIQFTLIAVLIVTYILLIGPVDYFFLNRVIGKMEWTWVTFPFLTILFCLLAWMLSKWTRPSEVQLNQLEIIDVEVETGQAHGKIWSSLYSPTSERSNFQLQTQNELGFKLDNSIVSWNGLPGDGLGGMQTRQSANTAKESYKQELRLDESGQVNATIDGLPMRVSSSRSLFAQWHAKVPFEIRNRPRYRADLDRIVGTIKNPLNVDLKNCRLVFDTWAYELGDTLEAGGVFDIQTNTDEQNLRGHFTQKRAKAGTQKDYSIRSSWDPAGKRLNRIADMLMFHDASGGVAYTGMTHNYYPSLDLTRHLSLDRAILIGEIDKPVTSFAGNDAQSMHRDHVTTIVRIIFPVKRASE